MEFNKKSKRSKKMQLSARNVIEGTIKSIEIGVVNVDVVVEIAPDLEMSSIITKRSAENLGLEVGKQVYVVIKASNVMIAAE